MHSQASRQPWEPLWDEIFSSRSWGTYPTEAVIRFIAKNFYGAQNRKAVRILDMGAGTGANTVYIAREGFDTYAIDGSEVAINIIAGKMKKEGFSADLRTGDINNLPYEDGYFDCVMDINCLMCSDYPTAKGIIEKAAAKLKPGGKMLSIGARTGSWGDGLGQEIGTHTFKDALEGPYANMGTVRFLDKKDIPDLFACLKDIHVNYYGFTSDNNPDHEISFWVIDGTKA